MPAKYGHFSAVPLVNVYLRFFAKARSHQFKIATDWLQTGFRLASDRKIGVNGTIQNQCNPTAFFPV